MIGAFCAGSAPAPPAGLRALHCARGMIPLDPFSLPRRDCELAFLHQTQESSAVREDSVSFYLSPASNATQETSAYQRRAESGLTVAAAIGC